MSSETGDTHATESSDVYTLDSGFSITNSVTWFNIVLSMDSNGSIKSERMSSEGGPAEGSIGVSKSKIPIELENGKV